MPVLDLHTAWLCLRGVLLVEFRPFPMQGLSARIAPLAFLFGQWYVGGSAFDSSMRFRE